MKPLPRIVLSGVCLLAAPRAAAQWPAVPAADFAQLSVSQFADHEIEVPYFLRHFAQVANAVVENPFNDPATGVLLPRGFLNIKVNREPVDNVPHNARIMEMQMALAYFYCADRPWNPYRGHPAVRVRLEAMLERWAAIQNQPGSADGDFDGLFTEYSATNWSLAPTGFGARAAAEALDLLADSAQPFDAAVFDNARTALRRALMAVFTRADMRAAARQYSNQFSGAYHAALIYLENWPDAALESAFVTALNDSSAQDRSPAGFWYEQGGPDFGYSGVHETSMRMALPRFLTRNDIMPLLTADDGAWNGWLAANHVPQPGLATRTFLTNAGINTRTSHSVQTPGSRPWSEFVAASRAFALTDTEFAAAVASRRSQVSSQFGKWGALSVPNGYSYIPGFVHDARAPLDGWHPTSAQRDAAQAAMPCFSAVSFNRVRRDPRPTLYASAKRPSYYAAVTTGNIRLSRQSYGLGLLWNPDFGIGLQSVAGTLASNPWVFGTKTAAMTSTYETANIPATVAVNGAAVSPGNGITDLAAGNLSFTYNLGSNGTKTITIGESFIEVSVTHAGAFTELLPLAHASDAAATVQGGRIVLQRPNGSRMTVEATSAGATLATGSTTGLVTGVVRRPVTITAEGSLSYRITMEGSGPPPAPSISVADASMDQPSGASSLMVFPVTLGGPASGPVRVSYQTVPETAAAGIHFTATSGTVEFAAGETSRSISVPVLPGSLAAGTNLVFTLQLSSPDGGVVSDGSATGTIRGVTVPPPPPNSVTVQYVPGNGWSSAYQGTFRITNSSNATITGWELSFDFTGSSITFFNGTATSQGIRQTFIPSSWQALIAPGTSFDNLGFQASPNNSSALPSNLSLRVTSATGVSPLQVLTDSLPEWSVGSPVSVVIEAGGGIGPYRWTLAPGSALPSGVTLSSEGMLSGAPTAPLNAPVIIRATDLRGVVAERNFAVRISAPDPWLSWQSTVDWNGADASAAADPDSDGWINLLEYALGGNPLSGADASMRPAPLMSAGRLGIRFRRVDDPALVYAVEAASSPGGPWQTVWTSAGPTSFTAETEVFDPPAVAPPATRFMRLRVSRASP